MISYFSQLQRTWPQLRDFLTSEEGGAFEIRDCGETPFALIKGRHSKGEDTGTQYTFANGWFRSVVWHKEMNIPVCVAPKKSEPGLPPVGVPLEIENIVDGVMVNVFVGLDGVFHVTTRSQYGATGRFYSEKTFHDLFYECLSAEGFKTLADCITGPWLPTEECPFTYISFVMQHPEHRVVSRPLRPKLVVVDAGKIRPNGDIELNRKSIWSLPNLSFSRLFVVTQDLCNFASEMQIQEYMREATLAHGWTWQGLMFRDAAGNRWTLRSETYKYLRSLRGNEPTTLGRFLRLRATGETKEYLKHYAEDREEFRGFELTLRQRTFAIYQAYIAVHKAHEKTLADIPQPDKTVVFKLHAHYLADLRPLKKAIQMKDVVSLVNALPLWEQKLLLSAC